MALYPPLLLKMNKQELPEIARPKKNSILVTLAAAFYAIVVVWGVVGFFTS